MGSARQQVPEDFPFKKILCFGDSVTLGVTQRSAFDLHFQPVLTQVEGYVPKLWRRLEETHGVGFELVNAGIGGETTREGVERLDYEIHTHDPDLILILEGIVDANKELPRFPVIRTNLAVMMRLTQIRGKPAIMGTYPLLNEEGFRIQGAANIPRLNDVIRQEAKAKDILIADHEVNAGDDRRGQGPDGLHPNNLGYEMIADGWFEKIEEMLEAMGVET